MHPHKPGVEGELVLKSELICITLYIVLLAQWHFTYAQLHAPTQTHSHACACMHTQKTPLWIVCVEMTQHLLAFHCHGCLCCLPWALLLAQSNITDINIKVGGKERNREKEIWGIRDRETQRETWCSELNTFWLWLEMNEWPVSQHACWRLWAMPHLEWQLTVVTSEAPSLTCL